MVGLSKNAATKEVLKLIKNNNYFNITHKFDSHSSTFKSLFKLCFVKDVINFPSAAVMCWYWICTVQCSVDWTHLLEETSYFSFLKSFKFFCLQWHVYRVTVYWNIYYELNIRQRSATYIWIIFLEKTVKFMVWVIKFTNLLD